MPRVFDRERIRTLLESDRPWAVYALGDLTPGYSEHCEWFSDSHERAILLVYRAFQTPVLFTLGEQRTVELVLGEVTQEPRLYLSIRPEIVPLIRARYEVEHEKAMWRMVLDPARFRQERAERTVRLGADGVPAIERLYADGRVAGESPDFFSPDMVSRGVFFGIREGDSLVAAAGTHLVAPAEGVAAIGNVYTRRDRRGRGLGGQVTSAVTAELQRMGVRTIALNVAQSNTPAIRAYDRIGFVRYCAFCEGLAVRSS